MKQLQKALKLIDSLYMDEVLNLETLLDIRELITDYMRQDSDDYNYERLKEKVKLDNFSFWSDKGFNNEECSKLSDGVRYYELNQTKTNRFPIMKLEDAYEKELLNKQHILWMLRQNKKSIHENDVLVLNIRFPERYSISQ